MVDKRGFTLIELLMAIAIIGVLAAVILASLNVSREKGRDANRISQMEEFLKAAELFYSDNGRYPDDGGAGNHVLNTVSEFLRTSTPAGYMSSIPADPQYNEDNGYYYCSSDDGRSFSLFAHLERAATGYCFISRGPDDKDTYCGVQLGDDGPTPVAGVPSCHLGF